MNIEDRNAKIFKLNAEIEAFTRVREDIDKRLLNLKFEVNDLERENRAEAWDKTLFGSYDNLQF